VSVSSYFCKSNERQYTKSFQIIFLTASGIIVFFHLRKSSKPVSPYSTRKDSDVSTSTERQYFITVAFMELGFTITIG